MELLQLPKNTDKEVFTVKHDGKYFAVLNTEENYLVSLQEFDSPLKASNHGRSAKKQLGLTQTIRKVEKAKTPKPERKIQKRPKLYSETEMASETRLKFHEVWLIVGPRGNYASSVLQNGTVVNYVNDADRADIYKSYEEANLRLNTLDMVIRKGHSLKRFFAQKD